MKKDLKRELIRCLEKGTGFEFKEFQKEIIVELFNVKQMEVIVSEMGSK